MLLDQDILVDWNMLLHCHFALELVLFRVYSWKELFTIYFMVYSSILYNSKNSSLGFYFVNHESQLSEVTFCKELDYESSAVYFLKGQHNEASKIVAMLWSNASANVPPWNADHAENFVLEVHEQWKLKMPPRIHNSLKNNDEMPTQGAAHSFRSLCTTHRTA